MRDENFSQRSFLAVYEVKYVKQNGIWKIKTLDLGIVYWVMDPRLGLAAGPEQLPKLTREQMREERANKNIDGGYDALNDLDMTYPEPGYVLPYHFNHPVTGKETSEVEWNKSLNIKPSDIPESLKLVKIYLKE